MVWKVIRTIICILACLVFLACGAGFIYVYSIIKDAPPIDTNNITALLSENSILYDDKGDVLDSVYFESKRTNVNYEKMPKNLRNAFIAVEDKTFWTHRGFNMVRMAGAAMEAYRSGEKISGTSTITQQLARNLYLMDTRREYTLQRKLIEAYYAVLLENDLTKEQILEAYLNRISLGFGASGVQAGAQAYFEKNVEDLTLAECAALAAIIQEPNAYALIKTLPSASVAEDNENILFRDSVYTYLDNSKASEKRRHLILGLMREQELITESEYRSALREDIGENLNRSINSGSGENSYFTDFAIKEVVADLAIEYGFGEEKAWDMLFNGGLRIYTTIDVSLQNVIESEFADKGNFPAARSYRRDRDGNILRPAGGILLYSYNTYFDSEDNFVLRPDEYTKLDNGDILLLSGKRLNFFRTEFAGVVDYTVNFKSIYLNVDGVFSTINEGTISIPAHFKDRDSDGNLLIKRSFFYDNPDFFSESDKGLVVSPKNYSLNQKIAQPQAAMVIIEHETGAIKAMAGGRGAAGRLLYNRSVQPRQPGSSIKPISVYGPALQSAVDDLSGVEAYIPYSFGNFKPEIRFQGKYWTAASVIYDTRIFLNEHAWPRNVYEGHVGAASMRTSITQSINVNAVKAFTQVGPDRSLAFLKRLGVSSVIETGRVNDMNAAALALGGMTTGISPLEMTGAFGAFANGGQYNKPVAYTKVMDRNGEILLENKPQNDPAMDPGVAFIMTDILRTVVTYGSGRNAAVSGRTVAGKTGTTSERYDIWFAGLTPEYSAALWIGNDTNLELNEGSPAAARLWGKIMTRALDGLPEKEFRPMPENVVRQGGEYFIRGTQGNSVSEIEPIEEEEEEEGEEGEGENGESGEGGTEQPGTAVPQTPLNPATPVDPANPPATPVDPTNPPATPTENPQTPVEEPPGWLFDGPI